MPNPSPYSIFAVETASKTLSFKMVRVGFAPSAFPKATTYIFLYLIYFTLNKTDLVNAIAATGLSKADSKQALDAVIDAISGALKEGDKVAILGFGTFAVTERPARTGINPATKEKIQIEAKKVIKFKAGAELAAAVK